MSVSIKYKGNEIAAMTESGTKTLNTEGKYCEGNIVVENTEAVLEEKTVALSMASGNQVVTATSGKAMSKVTVQKPSTLVPANIVEGVTIGGVTGNVPVQTQLWLLPETRVYGPSAGTVAYPVNFTSSGQQYIRIEITSKKPLGGKQYAVTSLVYVTASGAKMQAATGNSTTGATKWASHTYRELEFDSRLNSSNSFYAWLSGTSGAERLDNNAIAQDVASATITKNGTVDITPAWPYDAMKKATATVNVPVPTLQDEKSVSITANGTVEVAPDEGYDGVKKVSVAVNVPSSSTPATTTLTLTLQSAYAVYANVGAQRLSGTMYNAGTHQLTVLLNSTIFLVSVDGVPSQASSVSACSAYLLDRFGASTPYTTCIDITGENPTITMQ